MWGDEAVYVLWSCLSALELASAVGGWVGLTGLRGRLTAASLYGQILVGASVGSSGTAVERCRGCISSLRF